MGMTYRKVIKPLVDERFVVIHHEKGIFGYNKLVFQCSKLSNQEALTELEKYVLLS